MSLLRFNIDETKKEAIVINEPIDAIVLYDFINIHFSGEKKYELAQDCFDHVVEEFKYTIKKAINEKSRLHPSLYNNGQISLLGYQWCKYLKKNDRKDLVYGNEDTGIPWIGYKYTLFETSHDIDTPASWLYNDEHGNIIFELTPVYPWYYSKPGSGETFIKYSEWMKTYQPILIRTISKQTAKQWLKQIDDLIKVVKKNDKRLRCTGPGCKHCLKIGKTGCYCGS
ncbi:MAG: hypothetical protein NTU89_00345 [Candidatus Dependentiae bacterium]|nr:hypothetical protein [Candidatus Dependentiae bacterium]